MRPNRIAVERSWRPAGERHMHISAIHATCRYPAADRPVTACNGLECVSTHNIMRPNRIAV
jgi:hypothetical protein